MQISIFNHTSDIPQPLAHALSYRSGVGFFYSLEWFTCLIENGLERARTPRIYLAHNGDNAECALFMASEHAGSTLSSLTTFYTMEFAPIFVGENSQLGLQNIVAHIAKERPKYTSINVRYLRDGSESHALLMRALAQYGFGTHAYYQYDNWYLDVNGRSFDDYYNALSSRLKNTIKRKGNKANREHDLALNIYPEDDLELERVISDYNSIYAQSWKQEEPFPLFMPELFKLCDDLGILRAGHATIDGEAAAAQIWINDQDRTLIYKLAYDEKFAPMSIGSLLSKKLFEHAINQDQVMEIDYGVGNEAYKKDWMSANRTLGGILACNKKSAIGLLKHVRESAIKRIRNRS